MSHEFVDPVRVATPTEAPARTDDGARRRGTRQPEAHAPATDSAGTGPVRPSIPPRDDGRIRRSADARTATGLPARLKSGIESLSGYSLDEVRVHRSSARPAALGAAAFTEGTDIHIGPGQEQHLPHEAWHVVQQAEGRVRASGTTPSGQRVADDPGLEEEADVMGERASTLDAPAGTTAAPGRIRRHLGGPVQLRWGRFSEGNRADARGLLMQVNKIDPFDYELGGVLEEMLNAGTTVAALQNCINGHLDWFTRTTRATPLVTACTEGRPVVMVDAVAKATDDDARLAPLLDLVRLLHAAGTVTLSSAMAQVCDGLLAGGTAAGDIVPAVQAVPDLLTTGPRAKAVIDHRRAGGSDADARFACGLTNDDSLLAQLLTALRALAPVPGWAALAADRKEAVLGERANLTSDVLRANAVALAAQATDADQAKTELKRTRSFGYRPDAMAHAEQQAAEQRKQAESEAADKVTADVAKQKETAQAEARKTALAGLSRTHTKGLESSEGTSKRKDAEQALSKSAATLAEPKLQDIAEKGKERLAAIPKTVGEPAEAAAMGEYEQFFASIDHHPSGLAAIQAADDDMALATSIIGLIKTDPSLQTLLTASQVPVAALRRLVTATAAQLAAMLAAGMPPASIAAYATSNARFAFLVATTATPGALARAASLVPLFKQLGPFMDDGAMRAHLITLLVTTTGQEIVDLEKALPTKATPKLPTLATIRPKAALVADLLTMLTFCAKADWDTALLTGTFAPLANGTALAALKTAVYSAELNRFNKMTAFASWIYALDRLIGEHHATVRSTSGWTRLNGTPLTDEKWYEVTVNNAAVAGSAFCVHYHPGALPADVNNKNASKTHLKPQRGGTVRYTTVTDALLPHLRPLLQMTP